MIEILYAKYLLADRLNTVAEAAGVRVDALTLDNGDAYSHDVQIQASVKTEPWESYVESNERAGAQLLEVMPELSLRTSGGLIFLEGETSLGLTFQFYTGTGSIERVRGRIAPAEAEREPLRELVMA